MVETIEKQELESSIRNVMVNAVGTYYANTILDLEDEIAGSFINCVIEDIKLSSDWKEKGVCSEDDIKYAIGREIIARLS